MRTWIEPISRLRACKEAIMWCENYESLDEAWDKCERGDWMLWFAGKLSGKAGTERRKRLVLTACECARLALPYVRKREERPLKAIETAEQWARGENNITLADVRDAAAYAAYAAAAAAADADAAAAADAAAYAAYAAAAADADAAAAADAAAYAAYAADADAAAAAAADAAAYAADAAAYAADAARKQILKQCANIVRKHYPNPPQKEE